MRADPFSRVDGALLQRRVDVAAGNLLRDDAELCEHASAEARDAHLHAIEVGRRFDLLAKPAERLAAGIAHRHADDAHAVVNFIHEFFAVAKQVPGIVLARRQPERHRAVKDQRRILADVIARIAMATFDRAVRARIEHLQAGHDLARRERVDGELPVAHLADELRDSRRSAP